MSSKNKFSSKTITLFSVATIAVLLTFVFLLKPELNTSERLNEKNTEVSPKISIVKKASDSIVHDTDIVNEQSKKKVEEEKQRLEKREKDKGYTIVNENEFVEYVELPNGSVTPLFKSYIAGNEGEIEADFAFEKRDDEWASEWEITLNNIIANAASTFELKESNIICKSKICKIGVKLNENNAAGYNKAYDSLNREFVLNGIKVVPGAIKEKGTGYMIHYFIPTPAK